MPVSKSKRTIQYRYLNTEKLPGYGSLKSLIVEAMRSTMPTGKQFGDMASYRKLDLDNSESYVILNTITTEATWDQPHFGGQLLHVQAELEMPGLGQEIDAEIEEFSLTNLATTERNKYLKGVLYFLVVGNHLAVIESAGVRCQTLERYLALMLQTRSVIRPGEPVVLRRHIPSTSASRLKAASKVELKLERTYPEDKQTTENADQVVMKARERGTTALEVLRAIGFSEADIARLMAEIPADGWLEGAFSFFIKRKSKRATISRQSIEDALRNVNLADVGLSGNGREVGGYRTLTSEKSIETKGAFLDASDAMDQMYDALSQWTSEGTIDCDFSAAT